ncbi:hypothetical protein RE428_06970 [Marinobacter nanhaiticus D15-8W]|nr:hypothetical protein RE428_06970 [Marinobacter nanhaiticus D15-8W]
MAGVNADAPVFGFLAIDEVSFIALRHVSGVVEFIDPHAVILDAYDICILVRQPVKKTPVNSLRQAVDADRYYPHRCSLKRLCV